MHTTNPLAADSDGDGFDDGVEINAGTDPKDPLSTPAIAVPALPLLAAIVLAMGLLHAGRRLHAA